MGRVSHLRELQVWQRGMDLVVAVYRLTNGFPGSEMYGLTGQLRRAAVSVPSNIAEGHTRSSTKEYLNHLSIVQGSLSEVETQLEIANRLEYVNATETRAVLEQVSILGRQMYSLRNALLRRR